MRPFSAAKRQECEGMILHSAAACRAQHTSTATTMPTLPHGCLQISAGYSLTPLDSFITRTLVLFECNHNKQHACTDSPCLLFHALCQSNKVHALIDAYGLLRLQGLTVISPRKATTKELCRFHSRDYIGIIFEAHLCTIPENRLNTFSSAN
jgi:hypothetical protein